jgi:hypothetical protein
MKKDLQAIFEENYVSTDNTDTDTAISETEHDTDTETETDATMSESDNITDTNTDTDGQVTAHRELTMSSILSHDGMIYFSEIG